ncbi:hypothetical protein EB118_11810 [bacterium]|nr:hypothetical protein [bacterium]
MEVVNFFDYSRNFLEVKKVLAQMHDLLLNNKFQEAVDLGPILTTEARLLVTSTKLAHQNNEHHKLVLQQSKNFPAMSS